MENTPPRGRYFGEFSVGQKMQCPGRTITETDVVQFAGLSGDYNPLHTDACYAAETPFGQRIAHGLLGLSIASGLAARAGFIDGTVLAFTGLEWKFRAPVFIGDTVSLEAEVLRLRAMPSAGGGMVVFGLTMRNQKGQRVQTGEWSLLVRGRPEA
jgi:3-hydroxybutyryl-CoA dehydratase